MADSITCQVEIATGKIWDNVSAWIEPPSDFGSNLIQESPNLCFEIDYPLRNPKDVFITHEDGSGWTLRQFVEAVCSEYKTVYKEEGEDPGRVPGMLNRKPSDGPHGIWGHDITDLILEGAEKHPDGIWSLLVGS